MSSVQLYNGQAKPQQAYGITVTCSNVDPACEQGKTISPVVGLSEWLYPPPPPPHRTSKVFEIR